MRRSVGTGFEDRRGSQSHRPDSNHQDRDFRKSEQGSSSGHNNSHHNGRQERKPGDRDGATNRDRRERPGRDQPDPWTSWQRSKSTEGEPPPKRDKKNVSGAGAGSSRDREGRPERRDERRPDTDTERRPGNRTDRERRPGDRADRERRDKREGEERRKRDEVRKVEERRREEEKRLEEIKRREAEIRREEEKLRKMEEESRREMQRRRDEERRREEERKRNEERDRERRRREEQRRRSPSPRHRVQRKSPPVRQRRERSVERRHSSSNKPSSSRRRSSSSSRRQSALDRLGPKIPVVTRLGAGKVSRKRRRPGSNERSAQPEETAEKDNMQITITGEKVEEETSSGRKVARDVDIENFTVLDQVGEEEQEKPETSVEKQKRSNSKPETVVDLEKVVIKKRERKDERKSSDGKDFVVKKPSGLIAKLAKKKKDMPAVQTEILEMTDQQKSEIRKKCRAKYAEEDQVTEKVISMSLDLVHFNETETCLLIDSLLQEESEDIKADSSSITTLPLEDTKVNVETEDLHLESNNSDSMLTSVAEIKQVSQVTAEPVPSVDDGHDELDFEAEEPDKVE